MLIRIALSSVVLLGCSITLLAGDSAAELKKLEGQWAVIAGAKDGRTDPPGGILKKIVATISGDKMTITEAGDQGKIEHTIVLDPSKSPKWIDLIKANGPDKGKRVGGIYKVVSDELTICFPEGPDGKDKKRPTEFASPEGSSLTLVTFKKK